MKYNFFLINNLIFINKNFNFNYFVFIKCKYQQKYLKKSMTKTRPYLLNIALTVRDINGALNITKPNILLFLIQVYNNY